MILSALRFSGDVMVRLSGIYATVRGAVMLSSMPDMREDRTLLAGCGPRFAWLFSVRGATRAGRGASPTLPRG